MVSFAGLFGFFLCAAMSDGASSQSSVFCQTLHGAVQPAFAGLMKNDDLLEAANRALTRSTQSDRLFLRSVAGTVTNNLNAVAQLLANGFPQDANSPAHASEELLRSRLQAIASAQNDALNVIEGSIQSEDMDGPNDALGFHNLSNPGTQFLGQTDGHGGISRVLATSLEATRSHISELEDPAGSAIVAADQVCGSSQRPAPAK